MSLILFLAIGVVAGWLAGQIMKGRGFGLLGNMVIGVIGAFIGGNLLEMLGIGTYGLIGTLVAAVLGAIVLLAVVGALKKA